MRAYVSEATAPSSTDATNDVANDIAALSTAIPRWRLLLQHRGIWALVDQAIVSAASFLTVVLIGRFLGREVLGSYHLAIGVFFFLQCIAAELIQLPYLIRRSQLGKHAQRFYTGSILIHTAALTLVGMLSTLALAAWFQWLSPDDLLAAAFLFLTIALPAMMGRDFIHNLLHTRLEQFTAAIFDAGVVVTQLSVLALLAWLGYLSIPTTFVVMGLSCLVGLFVWWYRNRKLVAVRQSALLPHWNENWQLGRWALGSYLIGNIAPQILPWILTITNGKEATGLLAACMTLIGIAQMFLRGTAKYMAPVSTEAYAQNGVTQMTRILKRFTILYIASMSLVVIAMAAFGEQVLSIVMGSEYGSQRGPITVLAFGCLIQSIDMIFGVGLAAMRRTDANFWADCVRCATMIVVAALLIPSSGVLGVAWTMVLGTLAGCVLRGHLFNRLVQKAESLTPLL